MPKLPRLTAKDIIKLAEKRGFFLTRQTGSHMIYRNGEGIRITVPFHGSKVLHPKIIKSLLEDLKMSDEDLGNI